MLKMHLLLFKPKAELDTTPITATIVNDKLKEKKYLLRLQLRRKGAADQAPDAKTL